MASVLSRLVNGWPMRKIDEFMPLGLRRPPKRYSRGQRTPLTNVLRPAKLLLCDLHDAKDAVELIPHERSANRNQGDEQHRQEAIIDHIEHIGGSPGWGPAPSGGVTQVLYKAIYGILTWLGCYLILTIPEFLIRQAAASFLRLIV